MAPFSLISKISHLQRAALSLSRTQNFIHFPPSNNPSFIFNGWAAPSRAFCNIPNGVHNDGTKSLDSVMDNKNDGVVENAESRRSVMSILDKHSVRDIRRLPSEILGSEERLLELFEVWMDENKRTYPSENEKMRRFREFKNRAKDVDGYNSNPIVTRSIYLDRFADRLFSDPF